MNKRIIVAISVIVVALACVLCGSIFDFSQCSGDPVQVESETLVVDSTCFIGNYNCPKLYVKVCNKSNAAYFTYVDVNFYYQGEFADSASSKGVTLSGGDSYTFEIQSDVGTRYVIDQQNWTYKIIEIHALQK